MRYTVDHMTCPKCFEQSPAKIIVTVDPGCYRTANGDGWPASTEVELEEGPDACPSCGAVWTEADYDAMREEAVDDGPDADDYTGPDTLEEKMGWDR